MKTAIIGAGFSGLVAAVTLKRHGCDFTLYERAERAGKKILATGNGRCNISNLNIELSRYHGNTEFAAEVFGEYSLDSLCDFFKDIGMTFSYEGDKVYPHSFRAAEVLELLRLAEGCSEKCGAEVDKIERRKNKLCVRANGTEDFFDNVIVCTGGKAAPKLSGGGAYELLTAMGHKMTALSPSIVQLKCDGTKAMEGIKVNADVRMGKRHAAGEVLFTAYGLSGPPVMQLSRDAKGKSISIDLAPDTAFSEVCDIIKKKCMLSYITLENLFSGFINKKVGMQIIKRVVNKPMTTLARELSEHEIKALASLVKSFEFTVNDTMGFENAQITAGGIDLNGFDCKTMESKTVKGVYAAGEVLDVDGDCGGFNLQWAFSSAYLAAMSIVEKTKND